MHTSLTFTINQGTYVPLPTPLIVSRQWQKKFLYPSPPPLIKAPTVSHARPMHKSLGLIVWFGARGKIASMQRGTSTWRRGDEAFLRSSREEDDDEEALQWAALEKLPTYDRVRRAILALEEGGRKEVVDVGSLGPRERRTLLERLVRVADEDNERLLLKLKERMDRVGIGMPTIEVRFEHLKAEAEVGVGSRGSLTILNSITNTLEEAANVLHILPSRKQVMPILHDLNGIIRPRRMTLLLGPPGSGKTTLLLALAGRLDKDLKVSGKVTYNGHGMDEFVAERTSAYISQHDLHIGELTVRETLTFLARCQGVGTRYGSCSGRTRSQHNHRLHAEDIRTRDLR